MTEDAFSHFHPAVNFVFFTLALLSAMLFTDCAHIAGSAVAAAAYLLILYRRRGLRTLFTLLPLFLLIAAVNPLFNTIGEQVLFTLFLRPYTLEALLYGAKTAGMFATVTFWFMCYGRVMTGDRFTALFGNMIPSLSLLLVMIFRLVPDYTRKAQQIAGARRCIGFGTIYNKKEKLRDGFTVLSALTSWALENSLTTADSMRARGYGCARRTHFPLTRFRPRDALLCAVMLVLSFLSLLPGSVFAYMLLMFIPAIIDISEEIQWRFSISKI